MDIKEEQIKSFIEIVFFCFIKSLNKSGLLVKFVRDHKKRHNEEKASFYYNDEFIFPDEVYNNNKLFYEFYKEQMLNHFRLMVNSHYVENYRHLNYIVYLPYGAQLSFPWHLEQNEQYNDERFFEASHIMIELLSKTLPPIPQDETFKNWLKTL